MIFGDKYQYVKILSYGVWGVIYEVKEKLNEQNHYALKFMKNELLSQYEKEVEIRNVIKSKYILQLKDYFNDKINGGYCIVLELADGDLKDILNKYKPKGLPLDMIKKIFFQLNDALYAMNNINNDKKYIHRDLKPENILIKYTDKNKNNFDIKLTDFGFSVMKLIL